MTSPYAPRGDAPGSGAVTPRPDQRQAGTTPAGAGPAPASNVVRARQVIITGPTDGLFVYDSAGELVAAIVGQDGTDPLDGEPTQAVAQFGVDGQGQTVITASGVVELQNAAGQSEIILDPADPAVFVYSGSSSQPPVFGLDSGAPWTTIETALGVAAIAGWKGYNTGLPTSHIWPGADYPIPAGVTVPMACFKPAIQASAPYIDSADAAQLALIFAQAPVGSYSTCWQEGEAHSHGFTAAQIVGMHSQAWTIFQANAPAGAFYCQDFTTYSAYAGAGPGHTPMSTYVCCPANGGPALDAYFADWYPNTTGDAAATTSIDLWIASLTSVIAGPVIGIAETNYTTGTGGITWTGGDAAWFEQSYAWAVENGCIIYWPYFDTANGVPWGPPSSGAIAALTTAAQAAATPAALIVSIAPDAGTDPSGNAYLPGICSYDPLATSQLVAGGIEFYSPAATAEPGSMGATDVSDALVIESPQATGHNQTTVVLEGGYPAGNVWVGTATSNAGQAIINAGWPTAPVTTARLEVAGTAAADAVVAIVSGAAETWHSLTPGNSWANSGAGPDLQYRMVASPPNSVEVIGDLTPGTITNGTVIATLPSGYVPATTQTIPVVVPNGTPTTPGAMRLAASSGTGTIICEQLSGITGSDRVAFHAFISLDA